MEKTLLIAVMAAMLAGVACGQRGSETVTSDERPAGPSDQAFSQTQSDEIAFAEGELLRVDDEKDMIWIRTSNGAEMQFSYTLTTDVVGAAESLEGLAKTTGQRLRVHYKPGVDKDLLTSDEINTAVKIEVNPSAAPSPSAPAANPSGPAY